MLVAMQDATRDSSFLPLLSCFLCPSILRGENSPKEPTWDDQCDIVSSMKAPLLPSPTEASASALVRMNRFPLPLTLSNPTSPIPFIVISSYTTLYIPDDIR